MKHKNFLLKFVVACNIKIEAKSKPANGRLLQNRKKGTQTSMMLTQLTLLPSPVLYILYIYT